MPKTRLKSAPPGLTNISFGRYNKYYYAAVVQRLVHQPSKLRTWVRLPSAALKSSLCHISAQGTFSYLSLHITQVFIQKAPGTPDAFVFSIEQYSNQIPDKVQESNRKA